MTTNDIDIRVHYRQLIEAGFEVRQGDDPVSEDDFVRARRELQVIDLWKNGALVSRNTPIMGFVGDDGERAVPGERTDTVERAALFERTADDERAAKLKRTATGKRADDGDGKPMKLPAWLQLILAIAIAGLVAGLVYTAVLIIAWGLWPWGT